MDIYLVVVMMVVLTISLGVSADQCTKYYFKTLLFLGCLVRTFTRRIQRVVTGQDNIGITNDLRKVYYGINYIQRIILLGHLH